MNRHLFEALNYAFDEGWRIYEVDIRIALGWAHLANGEPQKAKAEAERATNESSDGVLLG